MVEESTPIGEPAKQESSPSLDSVIEGAITEVMKSDDDIIPTKEETKTTSEPDIPEEKESIEDTPDSKESESESLDQVAPENEEDATDSEVDPSEQEGSEDSEEPPLEAPQNWSEDVRRKFNDLPKDAQEYMLKRDKEMTADYTRKTQEVAEQRKSYEAFDKVIAPMRQQIAASGVGEAEYIARLLNADMALRNNPKMALKQLAQGYGIDLSSYDNEVVDWNDSDPQITQLKQQNETILAELNQFKRQNLQTARHQTESRITSFAQTKDDKGNLKYPHFEKVRTRMGNLIDAKEAEGLEDAYAKAIRLDDELYKDSLEQQRKNVKAEEDTRRKEAMKKAKNVRPRSASTPPNGAVKTSDLDTLLKEAINKAKA
jgi:hypothetical protein